MIKKKYRKLFYEEFKTPDKLSEIKSQLNFIEKKSKKNHKKLYFLGSMQAALSIIFLFLGLIMNSTKNEKATYPPVQTDITKDNSTVFLILSITMFVFFISTILIYYSFNKKRKRD